MPRRSYVTTAHSRPKVTVYIPCHNYARYLTQAVQSVLDQTYSDWELLIIDDGSKDGTWRIATVFKQQHPDRIRILRFARTKGLQACANEASNQSRGEYIIRLDADDYFDENALLVMASYLDHHPDVALVYPNYIYVDEQGQTLGIEDRKKIGKEAKVLDLPAHGACTLFRKRILKSVGGYNESYRAQDGHEIWLKILHRHRIANVSTPLFFYRQHASSQSTQEHKILSSRRRIKSELAKKFHGKVKPTVVAIIPAKNTYKDFPNIALKPVAGKPLIDYTIQAARQSGLFQTLFVTTDDPRVVRHCRAQKNVVTELRQKDLSAPQVGLAQVVKNSVDFLEQRHGIYPDIVVVLSIHCPLRRAEYIREAVHTLLLYNLETVISVQEDHDLLFKHGENGLELVNKGMLNRLRLEREALYVANGAIYAFWRDLVRQESFFGRKIGHITMPLKDSFQVRSGVEQDIVKHLLSLRSRNGK